MIRQAPVRISVDGGRKVVVRPWSKKMRLEGRIEGVFDLTCRHDLPYVGLNQAACAVQCTVRLSGHFYGKSVP